VEVLYLEYYNLLSIKNFYHVSGEDRIKINNSIDKNYLNSPVSRGITKDGYNFPLSLDDTLFFFKLYEKYKKVCYELFGNFNITPPKVRKNAPRMWCYRSSKEWARSNWHNHLASSTINGVYYYQVDGDGILFESQGKEYHYIPEQGELLIFPNDLNHRPDITTSDTLRYSINMEITTQESASTLFKNLYGFFERHCKRNRR
tara:strand:- start:7 stop:612 length:606 start_codon:yes stop_codon:yes gene_type:complete